MTPRPDESGPRPSRRAALRSAVALTAVGGLTSAARADEPARSAARGRINQSVCKWCYPKSSLEDLCIAGKGMGLVGIDLLTAKDFPTLKKHGLVCTMTSTHPLSDGLCDPKYHESSLKAIHEGIESTPRRGGRTLSASRATRAGSTGRPAWTVA